MRDAPVPAEELANTKRAIVAGFARSLESPSAILNNYIDSYVYKLPADYWDKYPDRIDAVTAGRRATRGEEVLGRRSTADRRGRVTPPRSRRRCRSWAPCRPSTQTERQSSNLAISNLVVLYF